jgi:hypothetical protein
MFNWIIQSSLKNRLLVITAYVIILLAGIYVVQRMTLDVLPEFAPPQVVIQTQSPGLSPEDVETLITFRSDGGQRRRESTWFGQIIGGIVYRNCGFDRERIFPGAALVNRLQ